MFYFQLKISRDEYNCVEVHTEYITEYKNAPFPKKVKLISNSL